MLKKNLLLLSILLLSNSLLINSSSAAGVRTGWRVTELRWNSPNYRQHQLQRDQIRKTLNGILNPKAPITPEKIKLRRRQEWFSTLGRFIDGPSIDQKNQKLNTLKSSILRQSFLRTRMSCLGVNERWGRLVKPEQRTHSYTGLSSTEQKKLMVDIKQAYDSPLDVILTTQHFIKGRPVMHVYDREKGYLIDGDFNLYSNGIWASLLTKNADQPSAVNSYLEFISRQRKTEIIATNKGFDLSYIRLSTSKRALKEFRKFKENTSRSAAQLQGDKQAGLICPKSIDDVYVIGFCGLGKKPLFRIVPEYEKISDYIGDEIRKQNLSQLTGEWLLQDSGLLNRKAFRDLMPDKNIVFTKDVTRGLKNRQKLNYQQTIISKKQIRLLNFLPGDSQQAKQAGLKWNSEQVKQVRETFWPLIKDNLDSSQVLTKELNRKKSFLDKLLRIKHKGASKDTILNRWSKSSSSTTLDIVISVAHGTQGFLHMPSGDKLSISDFQSLPHNAFKNNYIINFECFGGSETLKQSRADAFLEKGALGVLSPDSQIGVAKVAKALRNCFNLFNTQKEIKIKDVIREFKKMDELYERAEIDRYFFGTEAYL